MAAIAFDPLAYTRELEASGVPREQAEVHAKAMTATFLHNFDALVTRDYLDTRFTEFESRIEANMDKRFSEVDKRFLAMETGMDKRFLAMETSVDKRFVEMESNMAGHFADFRLETHGEIATVRGELGDLSGKFNVLAWMLAVLIAGMFVPMLQKLFF